MNNNQKINTNKKINTIKKSNYKPEHKCNLKQCDINISGPFIFCKNHTNILQNMNHTFCSDEICIVSDCSNETKNNIYCQDHMKQDIIVGDTHKCNLRGCDQYINDTYIFCLFHSKILNMIENNDSLFRIKYGMRCMFHKCQKNSSKFSIYCQYHNTQLFNNKKPTLSEKIWKQYNENNDNDKIKLSMESLSIDI